MLCMKINNLEISVISMTWKLISEYLHFIIKS